MVTKFCTEKKFTEEHKNKIAIEVYYRKHKEYFQHGRLNVWKEERKKIFNDYGWKIIFFNEINVNENNVKRCLIL